MWKLLFLGVAAVALIGVGSVGTERFEHRPKGQLPQLGESLEAQLLDARADAVALNGWKTRALQCEGAAKAQNGAQTDAKTQDDAAADARGSASWDDGYAAGRVAGARTCGGSHASSSRPAGHSAAVAGSVHDDFSDSFGAHAYTPAPVPAAGPGGFGGRAPGA